MAEAVLAGGPGAGKSLFFGRFARFLGLAPGAGPLPSVALARRRAPWGSPPLLLVDTPGLAEEVPATAAERAAAAMALEHIWGAAVLLHVVDAARAGVVGALLPLDRELAHVGRSRPGYAVVATKLDLPWAATGLEVVRRQLGAAPLLPVAAGRDQGFGAVRSFLRRYY